MNTMHGEHDLQANQALGRQPPTLLPFEGYDLLPGTRRSFIEAERCNK